MVPVPKDHHIGSGKSEEFNETLQLSSRAISPRQLLHVLNERLGKGNFHINMRRDVYIIFWRRDDEISQTRRV